jgi:1-acyl-sn-glycerol-3-phosphate acyltransferase
MREQMEPGNAPDAVGNGGAPGAGPPRSGSPGAEPGRLPGFYRVALALIRLVVAALFRLRVTGRENVPSGGCLIVSNHLSWTDTVFIAAALPPDAVIHTLAERSTVFNTRFKRWLLPRLGVVPISRRRGVLDEAAVDEVYRLLEAGERVLIFPEGAYGRDGQLRPLREGIGHFAINSRRPILPLSLRGTGRLRPFARIEVAIGEPFIPRVPRFWEVRRQVRAVVDVVGQALAGLGRRQQREAG